MHSRTASLDGGTCWPANEYLSLRYPASRRLPDAGLDAWAEQGLIPARKFVPEHGKRSHDDADRSARRRCGSRNIACHRVSRRLVSFIPSGSSFPREPFDERRGNAVALDRQRVIGVRHVARRHLNYTDIGWGAGGAGNTAITRSLISAHMSRRRCTYGDSGRPPGSSAGRGFSNGLTSLTTYPAPRIAPRISSASAARPMARKAPARRPANEE